MTSIKEWLRNRAGDEAEVVTAVRLRLDEKIQHFEEQHRELYSALEMRVREMANLKNAGASEKEIARMVSGCDRIKSQLNLNDKKTDDFWRVREVVLDLEMFVEAVIDYEWYGFLIRAIPEKKLPELINNERNFVRVTELVTQIIEKIEMKMLRTIKDTEELERRKKMIRDRAAYMKSQYTHAARETESAYAAADNYMAEFGIAQAPADLTMPAAAAANTNAKANHA